MHARGPTSLRPLITHTAGPRPSRLRLAHAKQSRRARLRACQPASFCLALASAVEALAPFVAELQSMASRRAVRSELDVGSTWAPLPHATLWPCRPPAPPRPPPPCPTLPPSVARGPLPLPPLRARPQVTGAEVSSDNAFVRELVNTLPNAHGTFMAQAIGTCQVCRAAGPAPHAMRIAGIRCSAAQLPARRARCRVTSSQARVAPLGASACGCSPPC